MTDSASSSSLTEDAHPQYSLAENYKYRRSRRGPTERFRHERERYYADTPKHILIKLLIEEEYESKKIRKLLDAALGQLETYSEHLKTAENEQHLALSHMQTLINVQHEAAVARQKAALFEMQFQNAKLELEKATSIISTLERQRNEAEENASSARAAARKLNEERLSYMAHEQGKKEGFEEGLRLGREAALADFEEHRMLEYSRRSRYDENSPRAYIEEHSIGDEATSAGNTPLSRHRTTSQSHRTPRTSTAHEHVSIRSEDDEVEDEDEDDDFEPPVRPPSAAPAPVPAPSRHTGSTPATPLQHPARERVRSMEPPRRPSSAASSSRHSRTSESQGSGRPRVNSTSRLGESHRYSYAPSEASTAPRVTSGGDYYSSSKIRQSHYTSESEPEPTPPPRAPAAAKMSQRQRDKQPAHVSMPTPEFVPDPADIQRSRTPVDIFLPHMPMPPPPVDSRPPSTAPMPVPAPAPASRMQMPRPTVTPAPPAPVYPYHSETPVDRNGRTRRGSSPESMSSNTGSISHLPLLSFPSAPAHKNHKQHGLTSIPEAHDYAQESPAQPPYRDIRGHRKSVSAGGWDNPPKPVIPPPPPQERYQYRGMQQVEDWRRNLTDRPPEVIVRPPSVTATKSEGRGDFARPPTWGGDANGSFLSPNGNPPAGKGKVTRSNSSSSTIGIVIEPPSRPTSMTSSSSDPDSPSTPTRNSYLSPNHPPAPLPPPQTRPAIPSSHLTSEPPRMTPRLNKPGSSNFQPNVKEGDHILHIGTPGAGPPRGFMAQPSMPSDPVTDFAIRVATAEDANNITNSFISRSPSAPPRPTGSPRPSVNSFNEPPAFIPPLSPRRPPSILSNGGPIPVPPPMGGGDYFSPAPGETILPVPSPRAEPVLPVPSPRMPVADTEEKTISPSMFTRVLAAEAQEEVPTEPEPEFVPVRPVAGASKKKKKGGKR